MAIVSSDRTESLASCKQRSVYFSTVRVFSMSCFETTPRPHFALWRASSSRIPCLAGNERLQYRDRLAIKTRNKTKKIITEIFHRRCKNLEIFLVFAYPMRRLCNFFQIYTYVARTRYRGNVAEAYAFEYNVYAVCENRAEEMARKGADVAYRNIYQ